MMLMMAAILFLKLLPVMGRYLHSSSIAGFLFVLGVFVTFISNIQAAIASAPAAQGPFGFVPVGHGDSATVIATARWNPSTAPDRRGDQGNLRTLREDFNNG